LVNTHRKILGNVKMNNYICLIIKREKINENNFTHYQVVTNYFHLFSFIFNIYSRFSDFSRITMYLYMMLSKPCKRAGFGRK